MKGASKRQVGVKRPSLLLHVSIEALSRHLDLLKQGAVQDWRHRRALAASASRLDLEGVLVGKVEDIGLLDLEGRFACHTVSLQLDLLEL